MNTEQSPHESEQLAPSRLQRIGSFVFDAFLGAAAATAGVEIVNHVFTHDALSTPVSVGMIAGIAASTATLYRD